MQPLDLAISVVIPLLNEAESLPELTQWISRVMVAHGYSYEILLIDDGSTDASWRVIQELAAENTAIKAIRFNRNYGKSAALNVGFKEARGEVVITMDADLQDSPDEIPELYRMITEQGYDLVSGWKKGASIRYPKRFLLYYLIVLRAEFRGFRCTTLTADLKPTTGAW